MAAHINFVRDMEFSYGAPQQVSPLIRRVVTDNPGPFTFRGTGVYIIGASDVALIDPGPDQPGQIDMLLAALGGARLTHIFLTHGHLDHSPAARPLAARTGAKIYASAHPVRRADDSVQLEEGDDHSFQFDIAVNDGDRFTGPDWTIEAVATPGHTSNHVAYALLQENALFSGDHIMGWSTTVITPPDGDMDDYLASLEKVRDCAFTTLWPTHGPPVRNVRPFVQAYIDHRLAREAQILAQLRAGQTTINGIVPILYADVDPRLYPAAAHSVLAHLIRLVKHGAALTPGAPAMDSLYTLP